MSRCCENYFETSKIVIHKATDATVKLIWNKIAEKIVKHNKNSRNVEAKREKILRKLRKLL